MLFQFKLGASVVGMVGSPAPPGSIWGALRPPLEPSMRPYSSCAPRVDDVTCPCVLNFRSSVGIYLAIFSHAQYAKTLVLICNATGRALPYWCTWPWICSVPPLSVTPCAILPSFWWLNCFVCAPSWHHPLS